MTGTAPIDKSLYPILFCAWPI